MVEAFAGIDPIDSVDPNQTGAVKIAIKPGSNIQTSTYNDKSFVVENVGDKDIAAIYFDITNALYSDTVFDPLGLAGDTAFRGLTYSNTGGTGAYEPGNNEQLVPFYGVGGVDGYEGLLLTFDSNVDGGYNPGEIVQFGVDVDPNSIVGLPKKPLDLNGNDPRLDSWDIGGVSGAELVGSTAHILFTDGTTAAGEFIGDGSQGGSVTLASQASLNKQVSLTVNGLSEGGSGSYSQSNIQVLVSGEAGDTARVVLTKGFIQPFDYVDSQGNPINLSEKFANSPFPANNAIEFQTVDVLLDGTVQDITSLFNFNAPGGNLTFPGDDKLPIGLVASIIDADELPIGSVTEPIYLVHDEANANTPPSTTGIADIEVVENADNTIINLFSVFDDAQTADVELNYEITGNTNTALFDDVTINETTGELTLDYASTGIGSSNITVSATDSEGLIAETSFTVTVRDPLANTAPTTTGIANITVTEEADNTVINLFDVFDDAQDSDEALTYEVLANSNPALFAVPPIIDSITGNLTLDYPATGIGTSDLTIRVTDTEGLFVEETFTVTVNATPPTGTGIRIEAEDYKAGTNGVEYNDTSTANLGGEYRPNEPVDIQATQDVGGGFNVGWIRPGEWLTYDLNVPTAGTYDLVFRVSTGKATASFSITVGGQNYTQTFTNTGGNQSWQDVVIPGVNLSAGLQELRMDMNSRAFNFNYFELVPADPNANTPPTSSGLADIAVNEGADNTVIALFDVFEDDRDADDALIYEVTSNTNTALFAIPPAIDPITGNLTLDYTAMGTGSAEITIRATDTEGLFTEETFNVTVSEPSANTAPISNGIADISVTEGADDTVIALFDVFEDDRDADQALTYEITSNTNVALFGIPPAIDPITGNLTLDYTTEGTGSAEIAIRATDTEGLFTEETFNVTVTEVANPGDTIRIEAEDYKAGTNGVEYNDTSNANLGGAYRPEEPVDIQTTKDDGGGFNVGWIQSGEWLTYELNIPAAGTYDLVFRVASKKANSSFSVTVSGQSYSQNFASTGGNQSWQDVVISGVNLNAGSQELRLDANSSGFNLNYFELVPVNPSTGNAPDSLDIPDLVVLENANNSEIDLYAIFEDDLDPDEALTYSISNNSNPSLISTNIVEGDLILDYSNSGTGTAELTVRATDTDGANGQTSFTATVVTPQADDGVIRINAGGGNVYDDEGNLFQADTYFIGGQAVSVSSSQAIANTTYDALYQTQRQEGNFSYSIPVPDGNYLLNAHIVDWESTDFNQRSFDLTVEGQTFYDDLDIFGEIQNAFLDGQNTAKVIQGPDNNTSIVASVTDGTLDINFDASLNNAAIAGLEIIPLDQPGVLIQQTNGDTQVTEGVSVDTYSVVLTIPPTGDVTVNFNFDSSQVSTDISSLTFNSNNWSQPQTVVVTPVDDELLEGPHTATINHIVSATAGSNYEGITTADDVSVTIIDNDVAAGEISFVQDILATPDRPTSGAFGQDGRLYVASVIGNITVYTLNDDNTIDPSKTETIDIVNGLSNNNITGIAFNPYDTEPKIYVSHSQFYANAGSAFPATEFSPYSGQVSVLEEVNGAWQLQPLVTGIGVSNHNHGVNGLAFDNNGDLFITSGSNTNAGIADTNIGGIDESPFTAAILKAEITKSNFNGAIEYSLDLANLPPEFTPPANLGFDPADSQYWGGYADVVPGVDVSVYASGLRNPYDLVFTTEGLLYATENNANGGFGDVSTGPDTQEPFGKQQPEELNLITEDAYFGHPNRNRGRTDNRQNIYFESPVDLPADGYTAPIATFQGSTNGITEYRANTFGGQLRGNLLAQRYGAKKQLYTIDLSANGQQVDELLDLNNVANVIAGNNPAGDYVSHGLDVITGPGGSIIGLDYQADQLTVAVPSDPSVTDPTAYDVYPWRAPVQGGSDFVIGGVNFDTDPGDTRVFIGNQEANAIEIASLEVSDTRIRGVIPDLSSQPNELLDIFIADAQGNIVSTIDDAFQPLFG